MPQSTLATAATYCAYLSLLLLVTSETDWDELTGILTAYTAYKILLECQTLLRGPYNTSHSSDFLVNLLYKTSDRRFKKYFRRVTEL